MLGLKGWGFSWPSWEDESGWGVTANPKTDWGGRGRAAQYQALAEAGNHHPAHVSHGS